MEVEGNIDDIRYDLRRLSKSTSTQPQQPPLQSRPELAAAACPGGSTVDWPSGHRVASITRERGYGSEEAAAAEPGQSTDIKKTEGYSFFKPPAARGPLPLPPPPPRPGGAAVYGYKKGPEDKRYPAKPPMDDWLQSLHSYRRARGLCIRCAEKWQPGHKCAPVLQLHALQEVWNLCQDEFLEEEVSEPDNSGKPAQLFMMLSTAAASSHSSARSLQLPRKIGGNDIIIFVDSGSTHSFLNTSVAMKLQGIQPLSSPVFVQVANGGQIACSQEIPMAEWSVHQHKFHSTLKVLDIGFYDMIIGMDRLQAFSPMKIHWEQKWMLIPYGSTQIALQGLVPDSAACSVVQLFHIATDSEQMSAVKHPPVLQALLDEFAELFVDPKELPPRRPCDHTIPLVAGAQPVSVRPYLYTPALKTEIEQQVSDMLQSG
ncbi:uncharacterized protein [Miscanthus floridulus]|uniref:uncharacterized protein n=1 Tax=Miscanthus floridulus TaxID=154761 RepID=UPI00345A46AD